MTYHQLLGIPVLHLEVLVHHRLLGRAVVAAATGLLCVELPVTTKIGPRRTQRAQKGRTELPLVVNPSVLQRTGVLVSRSETVNACCIGVP